VHNIEAAMKILQTAKISGLSGFNAEFNQTFKGEQTPFLLNIVHKVERE
jgi:hypothetical protein